MRSMCCYHRYGASLWNLLLALFLLHTSPLIPSSCTASFLATAAQHHTSTTTALYASPAYSLLALYIQQHSRQQLMHPHDNLCSRQFVVLVTYCHGEGNTLLRGADDFLWALTMNRTVVSAQRCHVDHGPPSLRIKDWIIDERSLLQLWRERRCADVSLTDPRTHLQYDSNEITGPLENAFGTNYQTIKCCQVADLATRMPFLGLAAIPHVINNRLAYYSLHESYGLNDFPKVWTDRFYEIVRNSFDTKDTDLRQKWSKGFSWQQIRGFVTYGHLLHMFVDFIPAVKQANMLILDRLYNKTEKAIVSTQRRVLKSKARSRNKKKQALPSTKPFQDYYGDLLSSQNVVQSTSVIFGVHVRHQTQDKSIEDRLDACFQTCLVHNIDAVMKLPPHHGKHCVMLFSTDRYRTLLKMQNLARKLQCELLYSPKNSTQKMNSEHGPWGDAVTSSMDIHLLSHAQYFMGMMESTYSMLLASMVAARRDVEYYHNKENATIATPFLWNMMSICVDKDAHPDRPTALDFNNVWTDWSPEEEKASHDCKTRPAHFQANISECVF